MAFLKDNRQNRRKIFDYHKKKLENPFYSRKKKINYFSGLKTKITTLVILLLLIALSWFIFASSFWKIKEVSINGLDRMSNDEILKLVTEQIRARNWLLIPQNNLLFFNQKSFLAGIQERYRFQDIQIIKKWPNKLLVEVKEKTLACIWNEADKYYYADTEGYILSEVSPLELTGKSHPLISNESNLKVDNSKILVDTSYIASAVDLFKKLAAKTALEINIEKFIVDKDVNTIKILTNEGVRISFNTQDDLDRQIEKLLLIKKEKLKEDFKNKKYIDLRFGDKVYFQ